MPNIKSAFKRMKQSEARRQRNRIVKTKVKSAVKKFLLSLEGGETQEAQRQFSTATRVIDKAASKGVLHQRTAARQKSRLARMLNKIAG